ncbi:hypothetical protein CYG49_04495 [Candidatus Saccharibacteria bacterium]|nr:MAG: hypothetical protein CYG49_04495 [Candidatus Saccharibacteria bacterium]
MKCPNDGTTLDMSVRNDIKIDYCPQCRGVWLDRGELDKLIERSGNVAITPQAPSDFHDTGHRHNQYDNYQTHHDNDKFHQKKRKESFLSDLFEL